VYETQKRTCKNLCIAFAKEMRLRQQIDFLNKRVDKAVLIEATTIQKKDGKVLDFNLLSSGSLLSSYI